MKDNRYETKHGYVLIRAPEHPLANKAGYVYEHRLVVEQMLGRSLKQSEVVHHINGDGRDNRPENLKIYESNAHHRADHRTIGNHRRPGEPNPIVTCECGCGAQFEKFDKYGRPRRRGSNCGRRGIHNFDVTATVLCKCGCETVIPKFDYKGREHRFVSGHNLRR